MWASSTRWPSTATSRWCSASTGRPGCGRSSPSHDTALGPARGGTRYQAYASEEDALEDALRLSKGMTYKFAFTDLPRGGGKAVLLKQEGAADKRVLLRSFGRFVQLLAGRFGTGPDLGTSAQEMIDIARETDFVWAIDQRFGGAPATRPR